MPASKLAGKPENGRTLALTPSNPSGKDGALRWLEELNIPYEVGFQIHGDLPSTWRSSYQPSIPRSNFPDRRQSGNPDEATKALRLFAKWLNEEKETQTLKEKLQEILSQLS